MRSPVNWALLGLVIERASYAYELFQRFERTYGDTLPLSSSSQIYGALDALEDRSMIEQISGTVVFTPARRRRSTPHYRATAEGVEGYLDWLAAQIHEERRRSRLLTHQLAALANDPHAALSVIKRYREACLQEVGPTPSACVNGSAEDSISGLTVRLLSEESRLAIDARLQWCAYASSEFQALAEGRG